MIESIFQSASIVAIMSAIFCVSTDGSDSLNVFQSDNKAPDEALKFGIYEISLIGDGAVNNPFNTVATVTFMPPSGQANAKTVYAFYDGATLAGKSLCE